MKSYDADTLTMLATGRAASRGLILFDFPSGIYGFWTGLGPLVYDTVTYIGAGSLIEVEAIGSAADLASRSIVCRLTSVPNSGLTPDTLATIENEQWHQSPVIVSRAYINPDTRALISVERVYRGYVDRIEHQDQVGGGAILAVYLESKSRDHMKRGYRMRGDADQRRVNAADEGLSHAATAGSQDIVWGRNPQASQQANQAGVKVG
jgi:hypothetical protein